MSEDIKIIIERPTSTGLNYKEFTSFSDINETIIRETELNILTLGNDLSRIYNKFELSSKKRKRDINIYECNPSVSTAWKKNIISFFSRAATAVNESFLNKSI